MKITLNRIEKYHLCVTNDKGHEVHLDNKSLSDSPKGASPMELLLMGVEGHREEGKVPSLFEKIHVRVYVEGNIPLEKVQRAAKLSFEKYCSVSKTLEHTADITYEVILNKN